MNDLPVEFVHRIEFRKYVATKGGRACRKLFSLLAGKCVRSSLHDRSCLVSPCNIQAYCSKVPPGFWRLFGSTPSLCLSLAASTCYEGYCKNGGTCSDFLGKANCRWCILPVKLSSLENGAFLLSLKFGTWILACMVSALVDRAMFV